MPLLHTSIPNLAQGVSQQPDNLRYPGQCDEQINAWSTVVEGLVKRPNSRFLYDTDLGTTGDNQLRNLFTHYVNRDDQNQYVITYDTVNGLKAFDLTQDVKTSIHINAPSVAASTYLSVASSANPLQDLRALTIADSTFLVNTKQTVVKNTDPDLKTDTLANEALIFVKQGDYEKTYNIFLDGQLVPFDSTVGVQSNSTPPSGHTYESGSAISGGSQAGEHTDTELIAEDLDLLLNAFISSAGTMSAVALSGGSGFANTSVGTVSYSFKITQEDGSGNIIGTGCQGTLAFINGSVVTSGTNSVKTTQKGTGYVSDTVANPLSIEIVKTVSYKVLSKWSPRSRTPTFKRVLRTTTYNATNAASLGVTLPTISSQTISPSATKFTTERENSVIKISSDSDFIIRVQDGLGDQALGAIYKEVKSITDLPKSCFNLFRVKIIGDPELDQDDYYVQFKTKDNEDYGEGSWVETTGWVNEALVGSGTVGLDTTIDYTTMPVRLIPDQVSGKITSLTLATVDWSARSAGDDNSNPFPSFVSQDGDYVLYGDPGVYYTCIKTHTAATGTIDPTNSTYWRVTTDAPSSTKPWVDGTRYFQGTEKKINDIFFFKNRLGFLTNDSVVFSEADEYFNFFRTTTQSLLDSAPIDVGISHTQISVLKFAQAFQQKLMIFSPKTQFVLRGGDLLTPKTVTISPVTEYDVSDSIRPLALSSYIYFNFKRNNFEGVLEYTVDNNTETYNAAEITEQVNKYIPNNIIRMEGSAAENMIVVQSDADYKKLYLYKYFWQGREKIQSAWMTFSFQREVRSFYFIEATLYVITSDTEGTYLEKIPMENNLVESDRDYSILLDSRVSSSDSTYISSVDYTRSGGAGLSFNGTTHFDVTKITTTGGFVFRDGMAIYTKNGNKRSITISNSVNTEAIVNGQLASYVSYSGNLYKCILAHTSSSSILPTNGTYWAVTTDVLTAPAWSENSYEYLSEDDFFVGFEYDMLYRFSKQNLKQPTERGGRSASDYTFQTIRNGSVEYADTGHFTVEVTPKFRDTYTYTYNPTLLASVSTLNKFTPETGFFKFAVQAQPNDATIEIKSSSALPVKLLAAEFESTMIPRSRRYGS
jgi:hypothetical protein